LPAILVTVSIALPPSPSLLLATLIATTVVAAAIALVVTCPAPSSSSLLFTLIAATVVAAAIALVVAHPTPLSLSPLLLPPSSAPSSLLATLIAIVIALFVVSAFTCLPPSSPSRRLRWGRGGPYPHRGCCWHSCSRRHPARRPTAVAAVVAAAGCQRWRRHNNTTTNTTINKTANTEGGLLSGEKETMCETTFFSMSRYVSTPGQCYTRQTSKGTIFWAGKVCFYVFMFKKLFLWTPSKST
jgi:hypothetical protein